MSAKSNPVGWIEQGETHAGFLLILCSSFVLSLSTATALAQAPTLDIRQIHIRDPFILADHEAGRYYLYANMENRGAGTKGWECYVAGDLRQWAAPVAVCTPPEPFWADRDFWAPEVHEYRGKYYLFGTLSAEDAKRGTQIFVADNPLGPFKPHSDRAATPWDWMALDGTLYVEDGSPWMVFCHEWVQIGDGTMNAVRLADDLSGPVGEPLELFHASDAKWCRPIQDSKYVTDGPCLHRAKNGHLLMLWSSFGDGGYTVGIARSPGGSVKGPWQQDSKPLYKGGGHSMLFRTFDGELMLVLHGPNRPPDERVKFFHVEEKEGTLVLADTS